MQRPFHTFLGIDLGGGKGKNTAVARLEASENGHVEVAFVDRLQGPQRQHLGTDVGDFVVKRADVTGDELMQFVDLARRPSAPRPLRAARATTPRRRSRGSPRSGRSGASSAGGPPPRTPTVMVGSHEDRGGRGRPAFAGREMR